MKSKEEVLNNALIVLNKPDKPWEVTIANDSIVVKWKWMDATFFAPNEITNEVKEYSYIVTLTVSDEDGNGHLTVTPVIAKNGEEGTVTAIQFNNIFKAAGEVVLQANKSLTGKALTAGAFEFTLTGNGQNQSKNNQEVENEASGNVIFDPIKYTQDDIGKTYTYEIREKKPDQPLPGYTYSEDVYLAKVAVSDQNGEIKTDVKYYLKNGEKEIELEEGKVPTFQNSYEASGKVTISGVKELTGNKALVENLFTFVLKDADGNKVDNTTEEAIITNSTSVMLTSVARIPIKEHLLLRQLIIIRMMWIQSQVTRIILTM